MDITQRAQQAYHEATALPEDSPERRERFIAAGELMQQGLEMLRAALVTGEAEQDIRGALQDHYTLNENVIMVMLQLDQCEAARLALREALLSEQYLPDGAVEHLNELSNQFEECHARVNRAAAGWQPERYRQLIAEGDVWLASSGEVDTENARYEASQTRSTAVAALRRGILAGEVREQDLGRSPPEELYSRYDELIGILIADQQCYAAERRLDTARDDMALIFADSTEFVARRQTDIESCFEALYEENEAIAGRGGMNNGQIIGWSLAGTAAVSAIVALGIDLASVSNRGELEDLQQACATGPCDLEQAMTLADSLDARRATMAAFTGVAIVSAIAGTVILLTNSGAGEDPVESTVWISPQFGTNSAGATFGLDY